MFGNVDSGGDRIVNGAFQKTITENGTRRVKHLWNHDFSTPPIASITELKEVGRDELPPEVLDYAPEATGGLMVARKYYEKNDLADWVLQAIDNGDVAEMSFGFDILRSEDVKEDFDGREVQIRELKELRLFDTSDVNWGMNAATVAVGAKNAMPLGALIQHLRIIDADLKAGRRNNSGDQSMINELHEISLALGCNSCKGLEADEKNLPLSDDAEAVLIDTSLPATGVSLEFLKLRTRALGMAANLER